MQGNPESSAHTLAVLLDDGEAIHDGAVRPELKLELGSSSKR